MTAEWTGDLTASYAYDMENRLTEVTTNHQGFISTPGSLMDMGILYSYDSLGRRVSREEITDMQNGDYRDRFRSSGERMSYLYDGLSFNMLAEGRDASGIDTNGGWHSTTSRDFKPTSEYLRTNGRVITRTDVTTEGHSLLDSYYGGYLDKGYYMEDSLGSVMGITNSKGSITDSYSYDSFGKLTEGRFDDINRLGYNGKRVDAFTGRYDYGFRDYDPVQMRWTTVDPIKSGLIWYAYVNNDPVNFIDPLGLSASDAEMAAYN
ncbi:MAG: RHS repeat-associated core domain-containing protein [Spirochaetia bacterium]|jgi:RHS repeat-associated protein|nr:RHS repeat-associated core domain-containing protein [Spirochaetia bacterium]